MKARVNQAGALRYIGGSGTSLGVMMDVSATPESVTPLSILSMEMRQSVEAIVVELAAFHADELPKVVTKTHAGFTVTGDLPLNKAKETMFFAADKHWSASPMLAKSAEITHEVKAVATDH